MRNPHTLGIAFPFVRASVYICILFHPHLFLTQVCGSIIYYPQIFISEPYNGSNAARGGVFTMFVIWYRRERFTMFIILLLISKTETKKQLIVWRLWRNRVSPKAFERFLLRASLVCTGRWSLRLAPLTVYALGLSTPSSYCSTLRR